MGHEHKSLVTEQDGRSAFSPFVSDAASHVSRTPVLRPNLSRAARRDIRQAAAVARKEDFHSFRIHTDGTVTWTLMHSKPESKPESKDKGKQAAPPEEPSQHALKSRARAAEQRNMDRRSSSSSVAMSGHCCELNSRRRSRIFATPRARAAHASLPCSAFENGYLQL